MSWVDQIRAAYRYNKWANDKILAAAAQVGDEDLTRERVSSRGSIAKDLAHIVQTQQGWFAGLIGEPPVEWEAPQTDVVATLRHHFDASNERYREYTERLRDEDLTAVLKREWRGEVYELIPWQVLFHVANHGTQHRAEVGIALLELDASPGDLDAVFFFEGE